MAVWKKWDSKGSVYDSDTLRLKTGWQTALLVDDCTDFFSAFADQLEAVMGFNNEGCCMLSLWVNPFNHKAIAHVTWWVALSPNDGGLTLTLYMQID